MAQIIENQKDAAELQATLNRLVAWADTWGMAFNVAKCHVMHIGPKIQNTATRWGEQCWEPQKVKETLE